MYISFIKDALSISSGNSLQNYYEYSQANCEKEHYLERNGKVFEQLYFLSNFIDLPEQA